MCARVCCCGSVWRVSNTIAPRTNRRTGKTITEIRARDFGGRKKNIVAKDKSFSFSPCIFLFFAVRISVRVYALESLRYARLAARGRTIVVVYKFCCEPTAIRLPEVVVGRFISKISAVRCKSLFSLSFYFHRPRHSPVRNLTYEKSRNRLASVDEAADFFFFFGIFFVFFFFKHYFSHKLMIILINSTLKTVINH